MVQWQIFRESCSRMANLWGSLQLVSISEKSDGPLVPGHDGGLSVLTFGLWWQHMSTANPGHSTRLSMPFWYNRASRVSVFLIVVVGWQSRFLQNLWANMLLTQLMIRYWIHGFLMFPKSNICASTTVQSLCFTADSTRAKNLPAPTLAAQFHWFLSCKLWS